MANTATKAQATADMEASNKAKLATQPSTQQWLDMVQNEAPKLIANGELGLADATKLFSEATKLQAKMKLELMEARKLATADIGMKLRHDIELCVLAHFGDQPTLIDGVWFTWDSTNSNELDIRLYKAQAATKRTASPNGTAKSYPKNTAELLAIHGDELANEAGDTYNELMLKAEAMEAKARSNYVYYQIRVKLIKLDEAS